MTSLPFPVTHARSTSTSDTPRLQTRALRGSISFIGSRAKFLTQRARTTNLAVVLLALVAFISLYYNARHTLRNVVGTRLSLCDRDESLTIACPRAPTVFALRFHFHPSNPALPLLYSHSSSSRSQSLSNDTRSRNLARVWRFPFYSGQRLDLARFSKRRSSRHDLSQALDERVCRSMIILFTQEIDADGLRPDSLRTVRK